MVAPTVTVYTKPACVQCNMTKRKLEHLGVPFTSIDVTEDTEALRHVTEDLGYSAAPVVQITAYPGAEPFSRDSIQHWAGYNPDLLGQLADSLAYVAAQHPDATVSLGRAVEGSAS